MRKVYVSVTADFSPDGKITPRSFVWEDGHSYEIDRVLDIKKAASLKVGGIGDRYSIRVLGKDTFMWLENGANKWFMEGRDNG
jgi:hypothetical protein